MQDAFSTRPLSLHAAGCVAVCRRCSPDAAVTPVQRQALKTPENFCEYLTIQQTCWRFGWPEELYPGAPDTTFQT